MEGHRSYPDHGYSDSGYPDASGWQGERAYTGEGRYAGEGRYGGTEYGGTEYSGTEYGVPDPRRSDADPGRPPVDPGRSTVGPRSGLPIPEDPAQRRVSAPPGSPSPAGETYRSRRPATAALFGVAAAVLEIPALLLLLDALSGDGVAAGGVISASCVMAALPLLAVGLYAVATGAVRAAGPNSAQAWLRPPVAYLSVGLVLFVAAGLAA